MAALASRPAPAKLGGGGARQAPKPRAPQMSSLSDVTKNVPVPSAYEIMVGRITNRVAEMAENITFSERPSGKDKGYSASDAGSTPASKRKPRKLEMRLATGKPDSQQFSAPFLDNTLNKMLALQNRMLKVSAELAKDGEPSAEAKKEQFECTSELSRVIALICAEKARQ